MQDSKVQIITFQTAQQTLQKWMLETNRTNKLAEGLEMRAYIKNMEKFIIGSRGP